MDQTTRNYLQRATQDARRLLEIEFAAQLEGTFDILPDGTILPEPGAHLNGRQQFVRHKIVEAIEHIRLKNAGKTTAQAVDDYLREAAFTFLNRFAALKMMEARGLVQQCVTKGDQSSGFKEFIGLAPGLGSLPDKGYQLYLECLFDELGTEINVLFDRRDSASLLWPRRQVLLDLLDILNREALQGIWGEDETIGWVYQYFNSQEERKKMRDDSAAPRNSRELAVRNQFFTPRYVVEFLTDNTLGRIWFEMTQGQTFLKDSCRYLVRRPNEIFLKVGEQPPTQDESASGLSPEELLKQPVHILFRAIKDPRDITMLDPACGSMHFGLYAFDLFERIYEEAWDMQASGQWRVTLGQATDFKPLTTDYPTKEDLLRDVPRLIIEHNIHGIDIDPRAVQIAGLSLWLRAQKSWQTQGVIPQDRPQIQRSNIACAEPMPGEAAFLEEFITQHLSGNSERQFLASLVRKVFSSMKLAGEAGSLLKIEEEIADEVVKAKLQWIEPAALKQGFLFDPAPKAEQKEFDLTRGITDESFWDEAEERIYKSLRAYSEQAEESGGYQRRLFANDAARGFAFIDLCRKRYDIVLMNPPFGESSGLLLPVLDALFPSWNRNILCAFIEQNISRLKASGSVASVMDRSLLNKSTYEAFRQDVLLKDERLVAVLDLGWEVLDANVEVACCIAEPHRVAKPTTDCFDVRDISTDLKESVLLNIVSKTESDRKRTYTHQAASFAAFPNSAVVYDLPDGLLSAFFRFKNFKDSGFTSCTGHQLESDRHFMLYWEIPMDSRPSPNSSFSHLYNGGSFSRFASLPQEIARFGYFAGLSPQDVTTYTFVLRNRERHFLPGVGFGVRGEFLDAHVLPAGVLFTVEGQALAVSQPETAMFLIGVLNSAAASRLLNTYCGQHKYSGYVNLLPCPLLDSGDSRELAHATARAVGIKSWVFARDETSLTFAQPIWGSQVSLSLSEVADKLFTELKAMTTVLRDSVRRNDELVCNLYGLSDKESRADVMAYAKTMPPDGVPCFELDSPVSLKTQVVRDILSYSTGCLYGRWDIRVINGGESAHGLPDPFAALPACPPAILEGDQDLPLTKEDQARLQTAGSWKYPIDIPWNGLLVDDPGHPLDIEARVQQVLRIIWQDRFEAIEHEACEILGVKTLREYFRKPVLFVADHLKRYSKSRRQAPIYWPLSSSSSGYTIWFYYHRFRRDTLALAVEEAKKKLHHEQRKLDDLRQNAGPNPTRSQREEIEPQEALVSEIAGFVEELARVAPLWNPDLNDGIIINYAPLWRMIGHAPWRKNVKECWDSLCAGDYDWAHLAMHLWPERVVPKCCDDASLAIAHGLDYVFWDKEDRDRRVKRSPPEGGWQPIIARLVADRTSSAVKAALESLLSAPALVGTAGGRRGSRTSAPRRSRTATAATTEAVAENLPARSRTRVDAPVTDTETFNAIKDAIAAVPEGASKADILTATGLADGRWNAAINALLEQGFVTRTGERRGTRYHLAQEVGRTASRSVADNRMEDHH